MGRSHMRPPLFCEVLGVLDFVPHRLEASSLKVCGGGNRHAAFRAHVCSRPHRLSGFWPHVCSRPHRLSGFWPHVCSGPHRLAGFWPHVCPGPHRHSPSSPHVCNSSDGHVPRHASSLAPSLWIGTPRFAITFLARYRKSDHERTLALWSRTPKEGPWNSTKP